KERGGGGGRREVRRKKRKQKRKKNGEKLLLNVTNIINSLNKSLTRKKLQPKKQRNEKIYKEKKKI
ncbi:hypothetical protein JJN43_11280, partial [Listeria monocytogenes]|nr:hypothetical protein [Listeria monocytogenes]